MINHNDITISYNRLDSVVRDGIIADLDETGKPLPGCDVVRRRFL